MLKSPARIRCDALNGSPQSPSLAYPRELSIVTGSKLCRKGKTKDSGIVLNCLRKIGSALRCWLIFP